MEVTTTQVIPVTEATQAAEARRIGAVLAREQSFTEERAGRLSLVIMEAATNLLKHAQGGEILLKAIAVEGGRGVEMLALDKGPGMADLQLCLSDGYSTAGSPGTGLGALKRQADLFDIYTQAGQGTALYAQVGAVGPLKSSAGLEIGAVCIPIHGETVCGDHWEAQENDDAAWLMVADGLGHGPLAAEASCAAGRIFLGQPRAPIASLQAMQGALKATRGAAVAVMEWRKGGDALRFAGIGNIAGVIVAPGEKQRHLVSMNGTVGHDARKIQEFSYDWPPDGLLVMASDGLKTQWSLDGYPGLMRRHPALIAGILYRDFTRGRDDATVVVARRRR